MRAPTRRAALAPALALVLGASLIAGCTSAAERAAERATGTDVEIERDGERVIIEGEDGSLTVESGGELPDAIAAAFTLPADYAVDYASTTTDGANTLVSVSGHLERSDLKALVDELTTAITAAGWTIVMSYGAGEDLQLIGASRDDQEMQVSMTATPGTSRFDVIVSLITIEG
jgi:hypothetical protein